MCVSNGRTKKIIKKTITARTKRRQACSTHTHSTKNANHISRSILKLSNSHFLSIVDSLCHPKNGMLVHTHLLSLSLSHSSSISCLLGLSVLLPAYPSMILIQTIEQIYTQPTFTNIHAYFSTIFRQYLAAHKAIDIHTAQQQQHMRRMALCDTKDAAIYLVCTEILLSIYIELCIYVQWESEWVSERLTECV